MKPTLRIIAFCMLLMTQTAVASDWVSLPSDNLYMQVYVDKSNISRSATDIQIWEMFNYASPQPSGVWSTKNLVSIHCDPRELTILASTSYSGPLGKGVALESVDFRQFPYRYTIIIPDSIADAVASTVC